MGNGRIYTDEMRQFIEDNYLGIGNQELVDMFNARFNQNMTRVQMSSYKKRYNLHSGLNGYFPKGHVPHNKGQKMSAKQYEKCKDTMYKKGNIPHNHRPVGSERITKDGYLEVKVAEPKTWKQKQRIVWEEHYGPVPKGSTVIFRDGNNRNFDIDNLICITRAELLYLNKHGLNNAGEITDTGILMAKLNAAVANRRKSKREDK